ncbi:ranBP2-type zinc finger protein At1g67325-like isoform X1 [Silene latifolia]|uniref:ranBP2-type zinc finger protein At1g67325-like isoform X1 n=1 Tax=Silene latifolia TaxID=37657 RepID=UPI003D76F60E
MRNCTQPRPADHNAKSAQKSMQPHQPYSSAGPYGGGSVAPPSSMYLGMPPYGSSMFNGSPIPAYDAQFSGGSPYHYNYANRMPGGSPYPSLHMSSPPPPYSGGMYGLPPPMMDHYGMSLPHIAPPAMVPRPGFFPDDKSQKKDLIRDNDWACPSCGNVNFSFRTVCNMRKCGTPKPASQVAKSDRNSRPNMPDGSWKCEQCGNINFPFRTKCNKQNCGAEKPSEETKSPSQETEGNGQVCGVIYFLCLLCHFFIFLLNTRNIIKLVLLYNRLKLKIFV